MRIPDHPAFIPRMLQLRLKQLATTSPVPAASFDSYTHRCGRPSCRCHHGGPLHSGQHLTFKERGKTRSVDVPKALLPAVRSWLAEHKRLKQLLHEVHQLSLALLQSRLNAWLDQLPDTRARDACTYDKRFLAWWGIALYLLQLGSRRQLDFELREGGAPVLAKVNRLAGTRQTTLPVHDTLDHFRGHSDLAGWQRLRSRMVQCLLHMNALDAARVQGCPVLLIDATGLLCFHRRHCAHRLVQRHGKHTLYLHQVLEAKLLGPAGVVLSLDSVFIDNADAADRHGQSAAQLKQDCELKALDRLLPRIKKAYPQLRFVLAVDNLYCCGRALALAEQLGWSLVVTFKEGRTPALWQDYQALLRGCPENVLRREWGDGRVQQYRWAERLDYHDSAGRAWKLNALECSETTAAGARQYFAWLTPLPVGKKAVEEVAQKGGALSLEGGERGVQPAEEQRAEPGARLQCRSGEVEDLLCAIANRLHLGAAGGARQSAAAVGGRGGSVVRPAVRQLEERGAAAAGERAVPRLAGGLVRRRRCGAAAHRVGQFVGLAVGPSSPGRAAPTAGVGQ
jgi:hypothetical protein